MVSDEKKFTKVEEKRHVGLMISVNRRQVEMPWLKSAMQRDRFKLLNATC